MMTIYHLRKYLLAVMVLVFTVQELSANPLIAVPAKKLLKKVKVVRVSPKVSFLASDAVGADRKSNVSKLINAYGEFKVVPVSQSLKAKRVFSKIKNGDTALYSCMKLKGCELDKFTRLTESINNIKPDVKDQLHFYYAQKYPHANLQFIHKKSGDAAERATDHMVMASGKWERLNAAYGLNGFDGLYITRTPKGNVSEVLITETKYGQSTLTKNLNCVQMSKVCILETLDHLDRTGQLEKTLILQLKDKVNRDAYRAKLFKVSVLEDKVAIKSFDLKSHSDEMPIRIADTGTYTKQINLKALTNDLEVNTASSLLDG